MMLEVSLDTLTSSKITAHQFLVGKLIFNRKYKELEEYLELTESFQTIYSDLKYLFKVGFINHVEYNAPKDLKQVRISNLFMKVLSGDDLFEELYQTYPVKVIRDNGISDYLRAERYNSEKLYDFAVNDNKSKHEHILKCHKYEINHRELEGSMRYMKRMYKWLQTQEWKSYEERVGNTDNANLGKEVKYGTELE
jgi:hypothetical protein